MKNDICFVGFGQCAGNIGSLLEQKGYEVLFINTADIDLQLLKRAKHVYKIPGEVGCNQSPVKAQVIFAQHYKEIMDKITQFVDKRIVYFICSAGGGTGGGMVPLVLESYLEALQKQEDEDWQRYDEALETNSRAKTPVKRKAGLICVVPSLAESPIINANSYEFMKQIGGLIDRELENPNSNLASAIILDNELSKDPLELNKKFVQVLNDVLSIPEKHHSVRGNVDAADLENAFTAVGITTLLQMNKESFSEAALVNKLRYGDVCISVENNVPEYWVSSTAVEVDTNSIEKEIGVPKTHYQTFNEQTNLFVFSGTSLPAERIELIADRAKEYKASEVRSNSSIFSSDVSSVHSAPKVIRSKQDDKSTNGRLQTERENHEDRPTMQDRLNMLRRRRT